MSDAFTLKQLLDNAIAENERDAVALQRVRKILARIPLPEALAVTGNRHRGHPRKTAPEAAAPPEINLDSLTYMHGKHERPITDSMKQVLQLMVADGGPAHTQDIARRLKWPSNRTVGVMRSLVKLKFVTNPARGEYRLNLKG